MEECTAIFYELDRNSLLTPIDPSSYDTPIDAIEIPCDYAVTGVCEAKNNGLHSAVCKREQQEQAQKDMFRSYYEERGWKVYNEPQRHALFYGTAT